MDELETGEQLPAEGAEETETPTVETEGTDAEDAGAEQPEQKPAKGVQKRIDELTREKHEARRLADEERQERARLQALVEKLLTQKPEAQPEPPAPIPATRPKPTMADCDFDTEKYAEEIADWKLEQRDAQARHQYEERQKATQQQTFEKTFKESVVATFTTGKEKFDDFQEVVASLPANVMHDALAYAVTKTSSPADVAYYLGKNPEEAARISRMNYDDMRYELGRLEGKAIVATPPKKQTNAPPPVNPVGVKAPVGVEPDSTKDPEAWAQWAREKALRERGRPY